MSLSAKHIIFNRYNLIAFLTTSVGCFLSWAISDGFFKVLFSGFVPPHLTRKEYFNIIFNFFNYAIFGFSLLQLIIPLVAAIPVIPFIREKNIMQFSYTRTQSYPASILKPMFKRLLIGCVILFAGYELFLCGGLGWDTDPTHHLATNIYTGEQHYSRTFMPDIFGEDFMGKGLFLFFTIDGIWKYFVCCFVYGLFAVCVSFYTRKTALSLIVPLIYYNVLTFAFSALGSDTVFGTSLRWSYLAPGFAVAGNGSYSDVTSVQQMLPLLPPLLFCAFTLVKEFVVKKRRGDVYAA